MVGDTEATAAVLREALTVDQSDVYRIPVGRNGPGIPAFPNAPRRRLEVLAFDAHALQRGRARAQVVLVADRGVGVLTERRVELAPLILAVEPIIAYFRQ